MIAGTEAITTFLIGLFNLLTLPEIMKIPIFCSTRLLRFIIDSRLMIFSKLETWSSFHMELLLSCLLQWTSLKGESQGGDTISRYLYIVGYVVPFQSRYISDELYETTVLIGVWVFTYSKHNSKDPYVFRPGNSMYEEKAKAKFGISNPFSMAIRGWNEENSIASLFLSTAKN